MSFVRFIVAGILGLSSANRSHHRFLFFCLAMIFCIQSVFGQEQLAKASFSGEKPDFGFIAPPVLPKSSPPFVKTPAAPLFQTMDALDGSFQVLDRINSSSVFMEGYSVEVALSSGVPASNYTRWQPLTEGNGKISPDVGVVVSPFDGTPALRQTSSNSQAQFWLGRMFQLDKDYLPGSKLAVYLDLSRDTGYYTSAGVAIFLYQDGVCLGFRSYGIGGGWTIPGANHTVGLGDRFFKSLVTIDINTVYHRENGSWVPSTPSRFNGILVALYNYDYSGTTQTILDEVRFKGKTNR